MVVWSLTSSERGHTHTLIICGSAFGYVLPPVMIYPHVQISECLKIGTPPSTMFTGCPKGWINIDIIENIPRRRPVLLIYDGHASPPLF